MDQTGADPSDADRSLQMLLDNMPDLFFFKDLDSRFTMVNAAHAAFIGGANTSEVIGKTDADFFPAAKAREFLTDERHLLSTGEPLIGKPESHVGANGQTRWMLTTKVPVRDPDVQITGLMGIARDITDLRLAEIELRQREARFGSMIQNALDIISILDADGTILYESPARERVLGYHRDELIGRNAFELVHPDDLPSVAAAFATALDDPALVPTIEFRFRHKDGSWRWLEATGTNLLADPAVGGVVVNSRDITERKEVEDDLRASSVTANCSRRQGDRPRNSRCSMR